MFYFLSIKCYYKDSILLLKQTEHLMKSELSQIPDHTPVTPENSLHIVTGLAKIAAPANPDKVVFPVPEIAHTHDEAHRDFDFISPVSPMGVVALTSSEREAIDYSKTPQEYTD
jgi:hypothetical protein